MDSMDGMSMDTNSDSNNNSNHNNTPVDAYSVIKEKNKIRSRRYRLFKKEKEESERKEKSEQINTLTDDLQRKDDEIRKLKFRLDKFKTLQQIRAQQIENLKKQNEEQHQVIVALKKAVPMEPSLENTVEEVIAEALEDVVEDAVEEVEGVLPPQTITTHDVCAEPLEDSVISVDFIALPENGEAEDVVEDLLCTNCGNCFAEENDFIAHTRECVAPTGEEQVSCEICTAIIKMSEVNDHIQRFHQTIDEKPKNCPLCLESFDHNDRYEVHMLKHQQDDERQQQLNAKAESIANSHGRKVVLKEFNCSFCAAKFTVVFKDGQATHRYSCNSCRSKFGSAKGQKPEMACEHCGRKYVAVGHLRRHMAVCPSQ